MIPEGELEERIEEHKRMLRDEFTAIGCPELYHDGIVDSMERPERKIPMRVKDDTWFRSEPNNRTPDGDVKALMFSGCEDHSELKSIISTHLAGIEDPPKAEEVAEALKAERPTRNQREAVGIVAAHMDQFGTNPRELIAVIIEEGLTIRQIARAFRHAEVTNARVTDWINAMGSPNEGRKQQERA